MKEHGNIETAVKTGMDNFSVTRQIDLDVIDKVDRRAFEESAKLIELPRVITDLEFVFVTLNCQATDKGKNEIWTQDGGAYITVMIPHRFALKHSSPVVTERLLEVYRDFVGQVDEVPGISSLEGNSTR